jgi:hypothetical protein
MAEGRGWLAPVEKGGWTLRLSPRFYAACRRWVARGIAWGADLAV